MEDLSKEIVKAKTLFATVKEIEKLTDNEVKFFMSQLSSWETKMKELNRFKVKIEKDLLDANVKKTDIEKLRTDFDAIVFTLFVTASL